MTTTTSKQFTSKHYHIMLALFVLGFLFYVRTYNFQFINFDDPTLASENQQVKSFDLKKIFTSVVAEDYIPLTVTSYAIDHALFGMNPGAFHLHNVLLHSLNGVLVFILVWLMFGHLGVASLVSFLFIGHPLHVESVVWIAERKDVLSTFYSLLTMIFYWKFLEKPRAWSYVLALLCLTLALFAKFMAVSVPTVLFLFELQRRTPIKKLILRLAPFAVLSGVFSYVHLKLHNSPQARTISLFRGVDSIAFYISKIFFPTNLSIFYEDGVTKVSALQYLFATGVVFAFALAVLKLKKYRKEIIFGALFFALTILPVLKIIPFGNMFAFGDRFMYLPSLGLFISMNFFIMALVERYSLKQRQIIAYLCLLFVMLLLSVTSLRQNDWKNSKTLWAAALKTSPQSAVAHNNLGLVLLNEADHNEAIPEFIKAAELRADYTEPYINLGLAYLDLKRIPEATEALAQALKINEKLPNAHVNMALVLEAQNQLEGAREHYLRAVELDPDLTTARYNLGVIYYRLGQQEQALNTFRETVHADPYLSEAHHGIGVILLERKDPNGAIPEFQKAAELDRLYEAPRIQLLNIYNQQGRTDLAAQEIEAIQRIQKELQNQPPSRPRR